MMIRYRVRREHVEQNLELLRAYYDELASTRPEDLRCATFQLADEVSFLDLVVGANLPEPLPRLPAFQRFRTTLDARCDEAPVMTEFHEVGSFRFH